jgi:FAD/FMN-containing dehydrogenase
MAKKIQRKDFIAMALLAPLGVYAKRFASLYKTTITADVDYITQNNTAYDALRKGFNKRISTLPKVIAVCKSNTGVAAAVQYAIANKLPIAIKSGGHCMEGFSGNNNGMVINLAQLNTITWINDDTVAVGAGCLLHQLYEALLPKGKIIPGGSCATVGIGGLVLGGGYGLLARLFGLTCDSLLELTMVDGKGNIVSSSTDKELLWACRGGGNGNFGIITQFVFKVHKAPRTMQSFRFKTYKADADIATTILKTWFDVVPQLPPACFSAFLLNGKTVYILLTNTGKYTAQVQQVVERLSEVSGRTTKTTAQPLAKALQTFYGRQQPLYFKNASAGLYKSFDDIANCIGEVMATVHKTPGMIYQVNTLGGNITKAEFEVAASFPHRSYPFFSELQTYWENPKQEKHLLEKFEVVQKIFAANGISAQYRNYPDVNFTNWQQSYYGNNYARLQQVKLKYDPNNAISHPQSITLP